MSEFIMKASTDEQAEFCRRYSNMQELVRCKDCIYMEKMDVDIGGFTRDIGECDLIWCSLHEFGREIDYYCADGERKEGR